MPYNVTAKETQPAHWLHFNGTPDQILDRYCVSELLRGWPVYRDASEWKNYRECFSDDAYVFTTWSGGLPIDDFIESSKQCRANGDFLMHRENGILVDLNPSTNRAIGKMKATITQRFTDPATKAEYDVDCDARFIVWCLKVPLPPRAGYPVPGTGLGPRAISGGWKMQYVKLFYEKDKIVPVDGKNVPEFSREELEKFPYGYRYLGAAQARAGKKVEGDMPTLNEDERFWDMYRAMEEWLNGEDVPKRLGISR
ncbi:hypothetical protein SI65_08077 [Aspergillus cristatus]|uniref:SnoaL-like domain-containing protein n=1 Tax=Aspergillus cristatus TaxID=573508 RepID=A0A1E3B6I3_ASPCR|nr:hypothetical protein SI65_08077 [Aspergillus cristatus]